MIIMIFIFLIIRNLSMGFIAETEYIVCKSNNNVEA